MKRVKMENNFIVPVLDCKCVEVTEIERARTIVWEHPDGTIYHQDCTTPHPNGVGSSFVYKVIGE